MGLTKDDQKKIVEKIHSRGMTLNGWARSRGFSVDTVKNAVYREWGIGNVGPVTSEIIAQMRKEDLA